MKEKTKDKIVLYVISAIILIIIILACYWVISCLVNSYNETLEIQQLFKEADFNISDNYSTTWSNYFALYLQQHKDTDWYSWEITVYLSRPPFTKSDITLWLNIETMETLYEEDLP